MQTVRQGMIVICLLGIGAPSDAYQKEDYPLARLFHGYVPGMTNAEAKKIGVANCEIGKGSFKQNNEHIVCQAPLEKMTIEGVQLETVRLSFNRASGLLSEIELIGPREPNGILSYVIARLGQPKTSDPGMRSQTWTWSRYDDSVVYAHVEKNTARNPRILMEHRPGSGRERVVRENAARNLTERLTKEAKQFESK